MLAVINYDLEALVVSEAPDQGTVIHGLTITDLSPDGLTIIDLSPDAGSLGGTVISVDLSSLLTTDGLVGRGVGEGALHEDHQ